MRKVNFLATLSLLSFLPLQASPDTQPKEQKFELFEPFTGKVNKNKVRLRFQPSFDSSIFKELSRDDLVIVNNETDDFYAISPQSDVKGYVYRTFVLDNIIEGTKVNVRLRPDLDAPVLTQLNSGDRVEGQVASTNNKWYEIKLPPSVQFYIVKDYVEKVGDITYISKLEKRHEDVRRLLDTTLTISATEMQKPFNQINIEGIVANYKYIISNYPDFPEIVEKSKNYLGTVQDAFLNKKIQFLESQNRQSARLLTRNSQQLRDELKNKQSKINLLEQQLKVERETGANQEVTNPAVQPLPGRKTITANYPSHMLAWHPVEELLFQEWAKETGQTNPDRYFQEQKENSFILTGIVEPYNRIIKNKPGDFMLVSKGGYLPLAFLYSTIVNLQEHVGREVSILVTPRSNHHFAYPAYFVLSLD